MSGSDHDAVSGKNAEERARRESPFREDQNYYTANGNLQRCTAAMAYFTFCFGEIAIVAGKNAVGAAAQRSNVHLGHDGAVGRGQRRHRYMEVDPLDGEGRMGAEQEGHRRSDGEGGSTTRHALSFSRSHHRCPCRRRRARTRRLPSSPLNSRRHMESGTTPPSPTWPASVVWDALQAIAATAATECRDEKPAEADTEQKNKTNGVPWAQEQNPVLHRKPKARTSGSAWGSG